MHLFKVSLIFFAILFYSLAYSSAKEYQFDKLIKDTDPNINIGVVITRLNDESVIYERNADRYYNFASSLKVLLTASAIEYFGEEFKFNSQILQKGKDYYLNIGDDPNFSDKDLKQLITQLEEKKLTSIQGNFYIINKEFKLPSMNPNKVIYDQSYCYGAPVSKTHINKNCFQVYATPSKLGEKLSISSPYLDLFKIRNETITIKDNTAKARIKRSVEGDHIKITGVLNESSSPVTISPVMDDNIKYMSRMIEYMLKKSNIKLHGKVLATNKDIGNNFNIIASNIRNISELYPLILQKSDNFLSDYLFQLITSNSIHDEWFEAGRVFKQFLSNKLELDLGNAVIEDGSGLSRMNMLTPHQMNNLLQIIYKKPYFNNFKGYLATPLMESTLKDRFKDINFQIYAKTGSMTGISSLVGYLQKDNDIYSFVIVVNNAVHDKAIYLKLQEEILKMLAQ